jgi:chlorobactene glucosyltransferase
LGGVIYLGFLALMAGFALVNAVFLRRLTDYARAPLPPNPPRVSVLVPARNEESNLERLILSLLAQDYTNLEIIVLDDHSTDRTPEIIGVLAAKDSRIRVLEGSELPAEWLGKNWACHQLARAATGEVLVFTDADTIWQPDGVRLIVQAMTRTRADALSAWPEHPTTGWFSSVVQPVQQWSLLAFLPIFLVPVRAFPVAVAAIGQLIAFRRAAYDAVGGHEAVRGSVIEDMALARNIKRAGLRFQLMNAVGTVSCAMYSDTREVWDGFAKNVYPGAGATPISMIGLIVVVWLVALVPWAWLILGLVRGSRLLEPLLAVALSLIPRALSDWRYGYRAGLWPLQPLSILSWTAIALESWRRYATGNVIWKGRHYDLRSTKNTVQDEVSAR